MDRVQQFREIRAEMVRRGIKGVDIARKLGVIPQAVYLVTSGRKKSRRVKEALIEAGVPAKLFEENSRKGAKARKKG